MIKKSNAEGLQYDDEKNWARLIYIAKRHLDIWSRGNIKPYHGQMKMSYMPLIFNISLNGSTNTELSKRAVIAKQAMSRTIKELEKNGMITSEPIKKDKRSYKVSLTDEGKNFVISANNDFLKLIDEYKKLVGKKEFEITVDVLSKIITYHEQMNMDISDQ